MHKTHSAESTRVVVFQLLSVDGSELKEALTHKKLTAKGDEVPQTLTPPVFTYWCLADCFPCTALSVFVDSR